MVKYCPGGDGPFEDWVERCPDCGRTLQADPPLEPSGRAKQPVRQGKIVFLTTIGNEPLARWSADILRQEGIEALVRASGAGIGAWGSAAMLSHDLFVLESDRERALEILDSLEDGDDEDVEDVEGDQF